MQKKKLFTYLLILFVGTSNLFYTPYTPDTSYPTNSNQVAPCNDKLPNESA